jgi:hypothetical protein
MMARGSSIPGHILTTHLPPPRNKKEDGPLVHREIYFKPKNSKATLPAQTTYSPALMAGAEVDAIDFELEEDDLMDDDTKMDDGNADVVPTPTPKLKSTITGYTSRLGDDSPNNTKRRGFRKETDVERNSRFAARKYEFQRSKLVCYGWKSFTVRK